MLGSSASFSLAMPRRMARATSWAWVPSWRSRSIRRSVAAEASTVWVRACSSERTRVGHGIGPEQAADEQPVDVDEAPHDPRRGEEEDGAEDEDPDAVEEARRAAGTESPGKTPRARPKTGGPRRRGRRAGR